MRYLFSDFTNSTPPQSCGFDRETGEDKFCCLDSDSDNKRIKTPQPPLFKKDSKAYPCVDHTPYCKQWLKNNDFHCTPNYRKDKNNFLRSWNSYPFMREVCQESCKTKSDKSYRAKKCLEDVRTVLCD